MSLAPEKKKKKRASDRRKSGRKSGRKSQRKSNQAPVSGRGSVLDTNQLFVKVEEMKDIGNSKKDYIFSISFDDEEVYRSPCSDGLVFEDKGRLLELPFDVDTVTVTLHDYMKLLKTATFKGKVVFPADELYHGYPYDSYFPILDKNGEEREEGELKIQMIFVKGGDKYTSTVFTKPLHYLTQENKHEFIEQKIKEGADVHAVDKDGRTAFHVSCLYGRTECLQHLADAGSDLELFTRKGQNGMHMAAIGGHYEIVSALIDYGIDASIKTKDDEEYNCLHLAAINNNPKVIKVLLHYNVPVDSLSASGDTALGYALKSLDDDMEKTLEYLLRAKPDLYIKNSEALEVWQIAQHATYGTVKAKEAFMRLLDIEDVREFEIRKKFKRYQREVGKNLAYEWDRATQMIVTVEEPTDSAIVFYQKEQTQTSDIYYVITKRTEDTKYKTISYQVTTEEFGNKKVVNFVFEPGFVYHLCPCSRNLLGDYSVVVYYESSTTKLNMKPALDFAMSVEIDDEWDEETAGGSQFGEEEFFKNPIIGVHFPETKEDSIVSIILTQQSDVVRANILDIVPGKYHIGFYIVDENNKNIGSSGPLYDALEVSKTFKLSEIGTKFDIVPCTQIAGQTGSFTIGISGSENFEVQ